MACLRPTEIGSSEVVVEARAATDSISKFGGYFALNVIAASPGHDAVVSWFLSLWPINRVSVLPLIACGLPHNHS